jgi:predicted enzyme related to lactoylglutathione lyase
MMKSNPVGWFEIYVNDMARAKKFYESVFEVKLTNLQNPATEEKNIEMWAFTGDKDIYGAPGSLVKIKGFGAGNNSVIIYFTCKDCAVEEKRFEKFGGKIHQSKMAIGEYGFISLVIDSEGNMIGLHTPPKM